MRITSLAVLLVMLSGCASTPPSTPVANGYCDTYDCAKMQRISKDARRNGHIVYWVTPPLKEKTQPGVNSNG